MSLDPVPTISALVPALSEIKIDKTADTCVVGGVEHSYAAVTFSSTGEKCEGWWPTDKLKAAIYAMNPDLPPDTTDASNVIMRVWEFVDTLGPVGQNFIYERLRDRLNPATGDGIDYVKASQDMSDPEGGVG